MEANRYLKNLFVALSGKNPYRIELDKVRVSYEETKREVLGLKELYYQTVKKYDETNSRIKDYQNLTENLRPLITEKDIELDSMRRELKQSAIKLTEQSARYENAVNTMRQQHKLKIEELEAEAAQLREDRDYALGCLQDTKQKQARECMANVMLERTNNWFDDFYAALVSGEPDEVALIGERDDLGSRQAKIAQQCVAILRRKKELETRIEPKRGAQ